MKFKRGVKAIGIRPELTIALVIADSVWKSNGEDLVVTSLNDSNHSKSSLHYAGQAADLRVRYFDESVRKSVADELRDALGNSPDYDVVLESDHIHLEYQPKRQG